MAPQKFASHAILNEDFFDCLRTMRELHELHANGAILNKRNWWVKWTTMPEVRAKWLLETEEALVKAHVSHVWSEWPYRPYLQSQFEGFTQLVEIAGIADETEKQAAIIKVLAQVMYPPGYDEYDAFREGTHYEEVEGEGQQEWKQLEELQAQMQDTAAIHTDEEQQRDNDNSDDDDEESDDDEEGYEASAIDTNFKKVFAQHKKMYAVGQIAWYMAMAMVREELRLLAPADWTRERIQGLTERIWAGTNQEISVRTCTLISAVVREGTCTLEVLRAYLPDEKRPNVLKLLQYHFTKIRVMLESTKASIQQDIELVASGLTLNEPEQLGTGPVHVPGPAPKTWMSDNCIPEELKNDFVAKIAELENIADDKRDWHPNTNNQVLNLVHPSLFCGVADETKLLAESETQNLYSDPAAHMRAIMFSPTPRVLEAGEDTDYQWLPCEIDVSEGGDSARIRTYINNLHPEDHAPLYNSIENIFAKFVPLFDQTLSTLVDPHAVPVYEPTSRYSLAGTRVQVIVKIAEIILTPEKPSYEGGSWHVEGTKAENIVATGLYYFGCENITESRLSFCAYVDQPQYEQSDHTGIGLSYGLENGRALIQNMGSVTAMEDRCVVFPNILHHKVEPFKLADPTKPGVRKILAFFLVNPTMDPVTSTAVVPPQQEEWASRAQEPALKKLRVPDTLVEQIQAMALERTTLQEAKEIRLGLMKERSAPDMGGVDDHDYVFNLCEH